ncbi:MAG: tRNA dihydrouridine synthase DusB [Bacteroidetes bacterium]|nr:tRNA dihydrouridine synthase DusB [Bacteroidota bacterium]
MKIGNTDLGEFPVILAPLEDITDSAFRAICKAHGADLVYTEFISSEALIRDARKSHNKLQFGEIERPLGVQIFGSDISAMQKATEMASEVNPELIDINFGCPVRKIAMKGSGAALLNDVPKMVKITEAVVKATHLPVTVKTRLGWDDKNKNIVDIAERLQDAGIQALTIHGRTRAQMYTGTADWTLIGEVKNNPRMHIPIIGNGDVTCPEIALDMKKRFGVDGIMIGRGAIGNPWIFEDIKSFIRLGVPMPVPALPERVDECLRHIRTAVSKKPERTALLEMRKHYAGYFRGIPNFKPVRMKLLTLTDLAEIEATLLNLKAFGTF